MADKGYLGSLLNAVDSTLRRTLVLAFEHTLDTFKLGGIGHQEKARNFAWIRLDGTTSTTANAEFSIVHGLGQIPYFVLPVLPVDSSGGWLLRLNTSRPADRNRVYFSSPDTGAAFSILVE